VTDPDGLLPFREGLVREKEKKTTNEIYGGTGGTGLGEEGTDLQFVTRNGTSRRNLQGRSSSLEKTNLKPYLREEGGIGTRSNSD